MPKKRIPPVVRFKSHVRVLDGTGCWEWQAGRNKQGYGTFMYSTGKSTSAHRWSYAHFKGPIPEGLQVLHSCDYPPCCNPEHLRVGTQKENMKECSWKRRTGPQKKTHCAKGHPFSPENTAFEKRHDGDGDKPPQRRCRECHRIKARMRNLRKRQEVLARRA